MNGPESAYFCPICRAGFRSRAEQEEHVRFFHYG